jgi:glycosyltransferase involved in cell wall biosynthesis
MKAASGLYMGRIAERMLAWRERQIEAIVRREGCDLIVACTGHVYDPVAAYRVSKKLGLPFIFYAFDDITSTMIPPITRDLVRDYIPRLIGEAKCVIVPNEFLAEKYRDRFGVDPVILHNPCDLSPYEHAPAKTISDEKRIVYTGAIYEAHFDAVRNLVDALRILDRSELRLHLYTTQSAARLASHGIEGPVSVHGHQPVTTMPAIQMSADILFLPLGFRTPYPETIRTSAPGKVGEYLASSTPILVHAPADTFLSWYFREYDCGLVVDQPDPALLARGIEALLTNGGQRERYVRNARKRSREDFDAVKLAQQFRDLVDPAIS